MSYSKEELAKYRIARAWESLDEARILAETGHWNTATNRLYYANFYIVSAYLILLGIEGSSHNGIKVAFSRELVKPGLVNKEFGRLYNYLFSLRQDADYRDYKDIREDEFHSLLLETETLVNQVRSLIELE